MKKTCPTCPELLTKFGDGSGWYCEECSEFEDYACNPYGE